MIQSRSSIIQVVDKDNLDGTTQRVFIGKMEFEATSHGELVELVYFVGGLIGEIAAETPDDDAAQSQTGSDPQLENGQETGEPRRRRVRRTNAQIEADNKAAAEAALANAGAPQEAASSPVPAPTPVAVVPVPTPAPAPMVIPVIPPIPVPAPAPVAAKQSHIITPKMTAAMRPREVVSEIFDQDKDAGRDPCTVAEALDFIRANKPLIPCILAMGDEWEARMTTVVTTIRSAYTA